MTEYQKYQLRWMIDHDHSIDELIDELSRCQMDWAENNEPVEEIYDAWLMNIGFCGEIWACEAEWKDCEEDTDPYLEDALYECDSIITPEMDGYDNAKALYFENKAFRKEVAEKYNYYWGNYLIDASDTKFECVVDALSFVYQQWKQEEKVK